VLAEWLRVRTLFFRHVPTVFISWIFPFLSFRGRPSKRVRVDEEERDKEEMINLSDAELEEFLRKKYIVEIPTAPRVVGELE
jgi:hypothetical protein